MGEEESEERLEKRLLVERPPEDQARLLLITELRRAVSGYVSVSGRRGGQTRGTSGGGDRRDRSRRALARESGMLRSRLLGCRRGLRAKGSAAGRGGDRGLQTGRAG